GAPAVRSSTTRLGRNFFAHYEEDSEESEMEDDGYGLDNPLAYTRPIGDRPPPADSFERRRRTEQSSQRQPAADLERPEGGNGYPASPSPAATAAAAAARGTSVTPLRNQRTGFSGAGRRGGSGTGGGEIDAVRGGLSSLSVVE
ncbi:unnamed protein product, partial [Scytosiphon promiscuus]